MKNLLCYIILFYLPSISIFSQDTTAVGDVSRTLFDTILTVDTVFIVGNHTTKDFVILREMSLRNGDIITKELIEYNKNRIYSLGLFTKVDIIVIPSSEGKANLIVEVSERWHIFPVPVLGFKDRDWSKGYYGIGIVHNNFRGRNEKLYLLFVLGYDRYLSLSYKNPFLTNEGKTFFEGRVGYYRIHNKSKIAQSLAGDFNENHYSIWLTLGKRFGISHTMWLSAGYEVVLVSEFFQGRTISTDGKDKFPVVGIGYNYDTRDLYEYPSSGTYIKGTITKFGLAKNGHNVIRYGADLRKYVPLSSRFVVTGRFLTEIVAADKTPSYNRVYLGYSERIRGHFYKVQEGENLIGVSSEIHYTLLEPVYIKLGFLPPEFSILRFGVTGAIFGDAGTVWFRNQVLALDSFFKGYGLGIHFLLPYSIVIRTEYAINEFRKGEFIIDLGVMY